ncbi:NAD/NADP-dependent octopine/nopaline dehydrogenase family protein [Streptomyces purpurogeneiscleroticus]|uniref:NAD/NADP-dependent octopine/nopaline dehydrogenase family protein n=1 Tax=Streptomyces purpurogeneiscleroticus TaxID=68259 RepID=UPI001CC1B226|nr:NAD/NADP-dependent octopine/nopaline dehydrogenase family protein [Streptomyces purpurogeneiscleroticus]MBZ4016065.1 NAD/NADP octopine/nopaline dehydrogenase [Streptomyces purpurogeneiscleroticus]
MSTQYWPEGVGVLGAGGEGLALAAHLAAHGESVHLCTRDPAKIAGIHQRRSIRARGVLEGRLPLATVGNDPGELARRCPTLFVATVTTAYPEVAARLAPYLNSGHTVVLFSGKLCGSIEFAHVLARNGHTGADILETDALFAARPWEDHGVTIHGVKKWNLFAGTHSAVTKRHADRLQCLFPGLQPGRNVIQRGLTDFGAVAHPSIALANISRIDRGEKLLFYREGLSKRTAVLLEQVALEFRQVGEAYDAPVPTLAEILDLYYGCEGDTALDAMRTVTPYRTITAPTSLDHRFLHEDVSSTLVPMTELARKAGHATPMTDALIAFASTLSRQDYRSSGRTLTSLGWDRLTHAEIRDVLNR